MSDAVKKRKQMTRPVPMKAVARPPSQESESKRGSFDNLVAEIEGTRRDQGKESKLSSAALRAGAIIRMMRKSRGFTQAMLARAIGVTQARVSELEAGVGAHGPSWDLMERIARACNATILVSPPESDIAVDVAEPSNDERHWTLTAVGS
ncbi:MAG: helix-turn-helix transcriptional regulator [Allosphingosinicella sp.]